MTLLDYFVITALVSLLVKFLWTIAEKWSILEWMQVKAPHPLIYKMLTCEFCRSFWLGVVICSLFAFVMKEPIILTIPVFSCNLR